MKKFIGIFKFLALSILFSDHAFANVGFSNEFFNLDNAHVAKSAKVDLNHQHPCGLPCAFFHNCPCAAHASVPAYFLVAPILNINTIRLI